MFLSIINRLILLELIKVFLMALIALTGLFLLAGLIQEATQRGLSLTQVVSIIPLLIPNTLPYTIPATTLFATCVVYGRMSHDNEILVLKAAGVNILHMLKPALILGVLTSMTTLYMSLDVIPRTQRQLRIKVVSDAEEVLYSMIKREGALRQPGMQYVMYVREVQGKRLLDVIFKRRSTTGPGYEVVARTREARLRIDMENNQVLVDMGRCVVFGEKDSIGADVNDRVYPMPLPESMFGKDQRNRTNALTWDELKSRQNEIATEILASIERFEALKQRDPGPSATAEEREQHQKALKGAEFDTDHWQRVSRNIEAEIQVRPALAFGCLCFVLIGCPVGIWASRSDYLSIFVVCFLPTVFVYYPLLLAGVNMAKDGKFPAEISVWTADIVLGFIAFLLIWRLLRR
ncbi:MAG: LptF/LptG family permease [Planctomycetes bacterium]|nr:LptF/LptG family permease [Planctomycetota bacterium]